MQSQGRKGSGAGDPPAGEGRAARAGGSYQARGAVALAVAAAAFLLVASLLRPLVPWPSDDRLAARAAWFARHAGEVDVLVFGSSTLHRGFDAAAFDARLAELDLSFRTQSFGTPGMNEHELTHTLESVLADCRPGLRFVLVEQLRWGPGELIHEENRYGDRAVRWHSWRETLAVFERLSGAKLPLAERAELALLHGAHGLWRLANLGQGARIAAASLAAGPASRPSGVGSLQELAELNALLEVPVDARQRFLDSLEFYRESLRRLPAQNAQSRPVPAGQRARMLRQAELVRGCGAEPIFVVAPVTHPTPDLHRLAESGELGTLLAYNRPRRYPELYEVAQRMDGQHLNRRGAQVWSRLLAEELAALATGAD
jgi:hypothetical protein